MPVKRREMSLSKHRGPRETQNAYAARWRETERAVVLCRIYLSRVNCKVISLNSSIKSRWKSYIVIILIYGYIVWRCPKVYTRRHVTLLSLAHIDTSCLQYIPKGRRLIIARRKTLSPSRMGTVITLNLNVWMCLDFSLLTRDTLPTLTKASISILLSPLDQ